MEPNRASSAGMQIPARRSGSWIRGGLFSLAAIAAVSIFVSQGAGRLAAAEPPALDASPFTIEWTFGAIVGEGEDRKYETIDERATLSSGTPVRMKLRLDKKAYVYVVYRDAKGSVNLLFPRNEDEINVVGDLPKHYWILSEGVKLDNTVGEERVYLVASKTPLESLARLARESFKNSADDLAASGWSRRLLKEVAVLKKDRMGLSKATSRPTSIGGTLKGPDAKAEPVGVEITAKGFLYKKYTIDHR